MDTNIDESEFICELYSEEFNSKSCLEEHRISHNISCLLCNELFKNMKEKQQHDKMKHNRKDKTCKRCPNLIFNSNEQLLNHIISMHKEKMDCFMCSECGKQFKSRGELTHHINSKCGTIKLYRCKVCKQELMTAGSLHNHMLRHKGEKNFMCKFCAKLFLTAGQLKVHERKHTNEKVFVCEVCNKGFCHRQSLITHSSIHTGVKPYQCENCGKSFSCVGNLIKHRKTHADSCGLVPLNTHSVKNPNTKIKVRINTPESSKFKKPAHSDEMEHHLKTSNLNLETEMKRKQQPQEKCCEVNIQDATEQINPKNKDEHFFIEDTITKARQINNEKPKRCMSNLYINDTYLNLTDTDSCHLLDNVTLTSEQSYKKPNEVTNKVQPYLKDISKPNKNEENHSKRVSSLEHPLTEDELRKAVKTREDVNLGDQYLKLDNVHDYLAFNQAIFKNGIAKAKTCVRRNSEVLNDFEIMDENFDDISICGSEKDVGSAKDVVSVESNAESIIETKLEKNVVENKSITNSRKRKTRTSKKTLRKRLKSDNLSTKVDYKCSLSSNKFERKLSITKHEKRHKKKIEDNTISKGIKCKYCKKWFQTKDLCREHQQGEHADILTCQQCDKIFANKDSLKSHCQTFHNGQPRKEYVYICDRCGKSFKQKAQMIVHKEHGCEDGPHYMCTVCRKVFNSIHTQKSHMRIHSPEKSLLCKFCGKKFRWKGQLAIHERSHTGEKPFKCLFCPKAFAYRDSLITHSSMHTGIKPHFCKGCGWRFSCIGNLIKHRNTHVQTCGIYYD